VSLHWNEMMSVGVPSLDADHRFLITLINHLNRAIGDVEEYLAVASVLRGVEDYAAIHFAREERLMLACGFPQFARHRQTHQGFITSLAALRHRYDRDRAGARDSQGFLNHWLIEHICSSDMGYRSWLVLQDSALAAIGSEPLFAPPGPEADWRQLTLLLAEDNLTLREILLTFLQGAGIRGDKVMMVGHADAARCALAGGAGRSDAVRRRFRRRRPRLDRTQPPRRPRFADGAADHRRPRPPRRRPRGGRRCLPR
jgi:hemerythrin-like metal-binding protein